MRNTELASAYERLLAAARAITPDSQLDLRQWADVDWTLCHIALSDGLLADAARSILDGAGAAGTKIVIDNLAAMDPEAIADMTASTTHDDRVAAVDQHAATFLALIAEIPQELAQAPLILRVHDRAGQHVADTEMTWADLVSLRSDQHIPAHADRLQGYLSRHHVP